MRTVPRTLGLELRDASGELIEREKFKYRYFGAGKANVPIYSLEKVHEDPERIRATWQAVVSYSIAGLLDRTFGR